eukprot:gnl/MRDRNA2_/MRDRNA2_175253_c0_seq1.p1 gnl/MRDRNA2_/MRDRNA2_175253_c0~~gnl/MRDRNA2_/MRDRNA2_175253_c0_seq1.p1  ORF type:complete len:103 (-),score=18.35 gnl/MRDRNA2_/MRDRNA2_175253_c0_seq1:124-432(-)
MAVAKAKAPSVAEILDGAIDRNSGVRGAVCLDRRGFTIGSRGELLPQQPAHLADLASSCERLEPGCEQGPVVAVETSNRNISMRSQGPLIIAVTRSPGAAMR